MHEVKCTVPRKSFNIQNIFYHFMLSSILCILIAYDTKILVGNTCTTFKKNICDKKQRHCMLRTMKIVQ